MRRRIAGIMISGLLGLLLFPSCTTQRITPAQPPQYTEEINRLQAQLQQQPDDVNALRELGVLYHKTREHRKAIAVLKKVLSLRPADLRSACYLGLSYEFSREFLLAKSSYESALSDSLQNAYHSWLRGRVNLLHRRQLRNELVLMLKQNSRYPSGVPAGSPRQKVVVLPVTYLGNDNKLAVLGKGFTEMLIADLSRIEALKVVERMEVEMLMEEVQRRESLRQVQNTTSGIGRLLEADIMIRCGFNVLDGQIIWDVALWDLSNGEFPGTSTIAGDLNEMLHLQKAITFDLVDALQIELGPAVRKLIEMEPTADFQAFLAYSAGLAKEDSGAYEEALIYLQKALELDPSFSACAAKIDENIALTLALKDPDKAAMGGGFAGRAR